MKKNESRREGNTKQLVILNTADSRLKKLDA